MLIFYDNTLAVIGKRKELTATYDVKVNDTGSGKFEARSIPAGAVYASICDDVVRFSGIITDVEQKDDRVACELRGLLAKLEGYRIPKNWHGWDNKTLSYILNDHLYGFELTRFTTVEQFNTYHAASGVQIGKLYSGDIALAEIAYDAVPGAFRFPAHGYVDYLFDFGAPASSRHLRWSESVGTKVKITIQSVGSDSPISDPDFSSAEELEALHAGDVAENEDKGVAIDSLHRYVAVRINLRYDDSDIAHDKAWSGEYVEGGEIVKRTYYGYTPVLSGFEIITRKTIGVTLATSDTLTTIVNGVEFSGTLKDSLKKLCDEYGVHFRFFIENGAVKLQYGNDLSTDKTRNSTAPVILKHRKNATISALKYKGRLANVLHCYGEGTGADQVYARVPASGTWDTLDPVEDVFEDSSIDSIAGLIVAGERKLEEIQAANGSFEVVTAEDVRLFDKITVIHPELGTIVDAVVMEEKKERNVRTLGVGGYLSNALSPLIRRAAIMRRPITDLSRPTQVRVESGPLSATIYWVGTHESFIVRYGVEGSGVYTDVPVLRSPYTINGLDPVRFYDVQIAGVSNGTTSEWSLPITVKPDGLVTESQIADMPTHQEIVEGFDGGGGTTTPALIQTLSASAEGKSITLRWEKQTTMTAPCATEIMRRVKDGAGVWSDYTLVGETSDTSFVDKVTLNLVSGQPVDTLYQYSARRKNLHTGATASAWTESAEVTASPWAAADVAADVIDREKMAPSVREDMQRYDVLASTVAAQDGILTGANTIYRAGSPEEIPLDCQAADILIPTTDITVGAATFRADTTYYARQASPTRDYSETGWAVFAFRATRHEQTETALTQRAEAWIQERASTLQAGSTTTAVKLDAGASAVTDYYKGMDLVVGGETRGITAYNGATKTATLSSALSSAPAAGTAYEVYKKTAGAKIKISSENGGYILLDARNIVAPGTVTADEINVDDLTARIVSAYNLLFQKAVGSQPNEIPQIGDLRGYFGKDPATDQGPSVPVEFAMKEWNGSAWADHVRFGIRPGAAVADGYLSGAFRARDSISSALGSLWLDVPNPFGATSIYALAYTGSAVVAGGRYGKLARSLDGGRRWSDLKTNPFGSSEVLCLAATWGSGVVMAGGASGKMGRSTNHGLSWETSLVSTPFGSSSIYALVYAGGGVFLAGSTSGVTAISTDNGVSWALTSENPFGGSPVRDMAYVPASSTGTTSRVVAVGGAGKIAIYDLQSRTWGTLRANPFASSDTVRAVRYGNGTVIAAGTGGKLARSDDFGDTWDAPSLPPSGTAGYRALAFGDGVFIAGGDDGKLARSVDGGRTWEDLVDHPFGVPYTYAITASADSFVLGTVEGTLGYSEWLVAGAGCIRRGTNEYGEYRYYADGRLECQIRKVITASTWEAWGGIYYTYLGKLTYPKAFLSPPAEQVSISPVSNGMRVWLISQDPNSETESSGIALGRGTSTGSMSVMVTVTAFGRWK